MIKDPKIIKYISYLLIFGGTFSLILLIAEGDKLNVHPWNIFLQIAGSYFFGFYFLWNNKQKPNKK